MNVVCGALSGWIGLDWDWMGISGWHMRYKAPYTMQIKILTMDVVLWSVVLYVDGLDWDWMGMT